MLDLVHADVDALRQQFEKTVLELRGTSCMAVDDAPSGSEQILCSCSFGAPVAGLSSLTELVSQFASRVAENLRDQQSVAGAVHVFITTSPFRKNDRQHSPSVTMPLVRPTADTRTLLGAAMHALEGMHRPGFNYVKAGVMLVDLRPQGRDQGELDLFTGAGQQEAAASGQDRSRLMEALDALNRRFGRGAVGVAGAVHQAVQSSHMARQERRSPRYTTRVGEVPTARG